MFIEKSKYFPIVFALVMSLLLAAVAAAGELTEKVDKTFRLGQGGKFDLKNTNGSVQVKTWERDEVRIEAEKRVHGGTREEAERLLKEIEIRIDAADNYVRVETEMPEHHGGSFWRWLFDGGSMDMQVFYWITLPKRASVNVTNTNGMVEVREVAGQCDVKTTNGRIVLAEVAGGMRAKTTNGSIELRVVDLLDSPALDLKTTNGSITVELPANFAGWVSARTTNGSIRTDFPVTVEGGFIGHRMEGKIGDGSARLELETTNGSIKLFKL